MGASSSSEKSVSAEKRVAESLASSTGALPMLQKAFSNLAGSQTDAVPLSSLKKCLCLSDGDSTYEAPKMAGYFLGLVDHVGSSIVDLCFESKNGGIGWVEFVRGYVKCCGRMSASTSLNMLFRVFAATMSKAGHGLKMDFESDDADCAMSGSLIPNDVRMFLWMCWVLSWHSRDSIISKGQWKVCIPEVDNLVLSAVLSCAELGSEFSVSGCNVSTLDVQLPMQKVLTWVLATVPCITDCLAKYVHKILRDYGNREDASEPSGSSSTVVTDTHLLTQGRAWAISLTLKGMVSEEILNACVPGNDGQDKRLLYRSSVHGKGLNRFWSKIEGYQGPSLVLISASSEDSLENSSIVKKWIVGALTHQSYENKEMFYGSSGHLYALSPVFSVYPPSGREKNFVYSHLHPTGRAYEANPKAVGVAFGGTIGNERLFIDEDFSRIVIRHHVADKTYKPGPLFPDQGYLAVEASVSEVEVWGLGGETAQKGQTSFKQREQLFTDQRRKIDLKTFSNWEDSPEKMMMDMVSDPSRDRREDR